MASFITLALLYLFLPSATCDILLAADQQPAIANAKWQQDLRIRLASGALGLVMGEEHEYWPHTTLQFTDSDTILVTFVTHNDKGVPSVATRDSSNEHSPLRLNAIFLDSATGRIRTKANWPTQTRLSGVIAAHGGKFVTRTGNELTLYGADLTPLRKTKLPTLREGDWGALSSPTGNSILFVPPSHTVGLWLWVDAETLEITHSWQDNHSGDLAISDNRIVMVTCTWLHNCEPKIAIRGLSSAWVTIGTPPDRHQMFPHFINEGAFFLSHPHLEVLGTDGGVMFVGGTERGGCEPWLYATSPGGSRFVIPTCDVKGRVPSLDLGGQMVLKQFVVHDASSGWKPRIVDVTGARIIRWHAACAVTGRIVDCSLE